MPIISICGRVTAMRRSAWVLGLALGVAASGCGRNTPLPEQPASGEPVPAGKGAPAVPAEEPAGFSRALWLWDLEVLTGEDSRPGFLTFCEEEGVSAVFASLRTFPDYQRHQPYLDALEEANRAAHEEGLKVYALRPMPVSPKLAYPKGHYVAVTYLRALLEYNAGLARERQFDGVLLDIQSHTLPGWAENRSDIQGSYVDFVLEMRKTVIEFHADTSLGWALPASYMEYAWFPRVCEMLDFVVLTGLGIEADFIRASAVKFLSLTGSSGTRLYLDLDTREPGDDETLSFFDTGRLAMERVVTELVTTLPGEDRLAGVSMQDYENLSLLEP